MRLRIAVLVESSRVKSSCIGRVCSCAGGVESSRVESSRVE